MRAWAYVQAEATGVAFDTPHYLPLWTFILSGRS